MDLVAADGAVIALEPFQAVPFSGEDRLSGRLRCGPVRDLNVMVLRRHFAAEMEIWRGPRGATLDTGAGGCLLVHSLAGRCAARVDGGEPHDRSEEHTSELQSLMRISSAVFCLKKKT